MLLQVAYVYLFLVASGVPEELPKAKIPLVELPAAAPPYDTALADPTPAAVLVQEAKVYLFLTVEPVRQEHPKANMPTVPSGPPALPLHPQLLAEVAPNAIGDGIALNSLKLG